MENENPLEKTKKLSRQRRWQNKRLAEGKCVRCGAARNLYAQRCDVCQAIETQRAREKIGFNEWKSGSRGRKPNIHKDT
jgi:hypothetical protein